MPNVTPELITKAIRSDLWTNATHEIVDAVNAASDENDFSTEQCIALTIAIYDAVLDEQYLKFVDARDRTRNGTPERALAQKALEAVSDMLNTFRTNKIQNKNGKL